MLSELQREREQQSVGKESEETEGTHEDERDRANNNTDRGRENTLAKRLNARFTLRLKSSIK